MSSISSSTGSHFPLHTPHTSPVCDAESCCLRTLPSWKEWSGSLPLPGVSVNQPGPGFRIPLRSGSLSLDSAWGYSSEMVSSLGLLSLDILKVQIQVPVRTEQWSRKIPWSFWSKGKSHWGCKLNQVWGMFRPLILDSPLEEKQPDSAPLVQNVVIAPRQCRWIWQKW